MQSNGSKQAIGIIPARLASTRLPRKVLADIQGRPLLWHVWTRASQAQELSEVFIATDSDEVAQAVAGWGGKALITSPDCQSGTERIASTLDRISGEFIMNIQGDEPLIDPGLLDELVLTWRKEQADLVTPVFPIHDLASLNNPNVVKVARTQDGRALYFSRSAIPFVRDLPLERWLENHAFWGHIGVYGYRREALAAYPRLPESPLEAAERLEQLRFLDAGYRIHTVETNYRSIAVDTREDLERVREITQSKGYG